MSLADRTPGPAGSGLIGALPLGEPTKRSKKNRSGRGRNDPVFKTRKVVIQCDKTDPSTLHVDPAYVARVATYGGRIAAKAGLTVDEVRQLARRFA